MYYIACYTAALNTVSALLEWLTALLECLNLNVAGFWKPQKPPGAAPGTTPRFTTELCINVLF